MKTTTHKATISAKHPTRIGILAGHGRLPEILAETVITNGCVPYVVNLTSSTPNWMSLFDHIDVPITRLSTLLKTLRKAGISQLVLAGGINERPKLLSFLRDWRMYGKFFHLVRALRKGDDGLLRAAIGLLERSGFTVVGAHEIAPSLLAGEGVLTSTQPKDNDLRDISLGIDAAISLGRLDRGQAVVVRSGQIIAQESRRGTAAMLGALALDAPHVPTGILVKWSKPNQELRVDLPSIGPDTIIQVKNAGLAGIVVEADHALILDRQEVIRLADANNVFVAGLRGKP